MIFVLIYTSNSIPYSSTTLLSNIGHSSNQIIIKVINNHQIMQSNNIILQFMKN